ncbi:MAG: proprotein convertase P-domain-containing protein [Deltaproteobacteria bacterium]|nr:proprotein convertase P-domain-containing protein [Deltaproteobacteria bacterium]
MQRSRSGRILGAIAAACSLAAPVHAAPGTSLVEGVLQSGSGPVADGIYNATFAVYADETAATALWSEGPVALNVKAGQWQWALGAKTPLDLAKLGGQKPWLGLQIGGDPEMPRAKIHSVLYAARALLAEGLDCSGCITAAALSPNVLQPYAKSADLAVVGKSGNYADLKGVPDLTAYAKAADLSLYAKTAALADVAKTGAFGDLKDVPVLAKVGAGCGSGLVVKGLKADGSLDCVSGVDPLVATLFSSTINQPFVQQVGAELLDGQPAFYVSGELTVPALGSTELVEIDVDIDNSDVSQLKIEATDPAGNLLTLYNGGVTGTSLKTTFPTKTPIAEGSLDGWKGKDPKGTWMLIVRDKVKMANSNGKDGIFKSFAVRVQYKAQGKMQVKSDLVGPDAMPYTRMRSAVDDALADGKSLTVKTNGGAPLVAQGWLWDKSLNTWIEANTGASSTGGCPACGTGKDGDYNATGNANLAGGTYEFKSFTIKEGVTVTVTGSTPLQIKVQGTAVVDGTLHLGGGDAPSVNACCPDAPPGAGTAGGAAGGLGPGGGGSNSGLGPGGGGGGCAAGYGAGGGGAGHATSGQSGTTTGNSCGTPGGGGGTYGDAKLSNGLEPGSGGGSGGYGSAANSAGSGGGGGGGAVLIVASKVLVGAKGQIVADGGKGGDVVNDRDGGAGGGGSGGSIWLRASTVSIAGKVSAVGGAGGKSDKVNGYGGDGGNGGNGRIVVDSVQAATGTTTPSFATAGTTGLDLIGTNKFSLQNNGSGVVSLINQSGATQKVMLVVTHY